MKAFGVLALPVVGLLIASTMPAAAAAQGTTPRLVKKQAVVGSRAAVEQETDTRIRRRPKCERRSRSRFVCRVRWNDGLRRFRGTVAIRRSGTPVSPIDTYRIRASGRARYLNRERIRATGRLIVKTRYAHLTETLRLLGWSFENSEVEVTFGQPVDPFVSPNEFFTPEPGTRFVAYPVTVRNLGEERFTDSLYGAALILQGGISLDTALAVDCDPDIDMAPGETRQACVAFEVPMGATIEQVEFSPGQETGVWRP